MSNVDHPRAEQTALDVLMNGYSYPLKITPGDMHEAWECLGPMAMDRIASAFADWELDEGEVRLRLAAFWAAAEQLPFLTSDYFDWLLATGCTGTIRAVAEKRFNLISAEEDQS
ncbi:hypothetical protein [Phenylobacterium sp.]|uniref:hypothetical protein n=1 Tax=Phenylobacterium sp. TaxID=1871053 RepID=UPI0035AEAB73